MKVLFYSIRDYEEVYLKAAAGKEMECVFFPELLSIQTADEARNAEAVCIFTNDDASAEVLEKLHAHGVKFIAVRAAGYDNVDIVKAHELGFGVANVPEYSPHAVAEHAVALLMALTRKITIADEQVHRYDFTIGNLVGFDLYQKTVGIAGLGRIGSIFARIMYGFGCRLLGFDMHENEALKENYGLQYVDLPTLCSESDIISVHTPLTASTRHLINKAHIGLMRKEAMLINTSRGACLDTAALLSALENGQIRYFGADVYEFEKGVFFYDLSGKDLSDEKLKKLLSLPNVLITPHQAFATQEALSNIASTTFYNLDCMANHRPCENALAASAVTVHTT